MRRGLRKRAISESLANAADASFPEARRLAECSGASLVKFSRIHYRIRIAGDAVELFPTTCGSASKSGRRYPLPESWTLPDAVRCVLMGPVESTTTQAKFDW